MKQLHTRPGKNGKVHVYVDGTYEMTVDMAFWSDLRLKDGTVISQESFERLKEQIHVRRAYQKGVSLLALREHSEKELHDKLCQKGFSDGARQACALLREQGYLNDERYAQILFRHLVQEKHYGLIRARMEMLQKGIERELADRIIAETACDEVEQIIFLLNSKYRNYKRDDNSRKKCYNALIRQGFRIADIRRAMSELEETQNE